MTATARHTARVAGLVVAVTLGYLLPDVRPAAAAQDPDPEALLVRPAPPKLDDFETDRNNDGVPDGWYNLRDATFVNDGGVVGPKFLRFECEHAGRPARLSRAFGVDGRKYEAIRIGLWVRTERVQSGERLGDEPGLIIDLLGAKLRQVTRGSLGPWNTRTMGGHPGWTRVVKRIPVLPATRDAILSVGLLGATGRLDIDGMTIELEPIGGASTTNLVRNGDLELGDPEPAGWTVDGGARRSFPGFHSSSAFELGKAGARGMVGLALPIDRYPSLTVALMARGVGLRGSGGASAFVFFLDDDGRVLPGLEAGVRLFSWSGTFDWRDETTTLPVPRGASHAVLQLDKADGLGTLRVDDLVVTAEPDPSAGKWTPYHVEVADTDRWVDVAPSTGIEAKSALDFSFLLDGPAGKHGAVAVRDGRFHFTRGGFRARFLGVQLLPPAAFQAPEKADALADRLARSGINLVRIGDLDTPLGPERSLFDDTRDDTDRLDTAALARLDHMVAALKARGIYVALELHSSRQFRSEDGVTLPGSLPPGGGPAAVFDPVITRKIDTAAHALLDHVNAETGVAYKAEPALAWVTLAGETSLFDLAAGFGLLPADYAKAFHELAAKSTERNGRRFWQAVEEARWKSLADALRKAGLKAPVASVSHWRREREFSDALAGPGLDLVDDRIYWAGPPWISPRYRSSLWSLDGGLIADAARKRRSDRPYVLGQWCDMTSGVWASPYEAAEQVLAARTASVEDWDALVRRGVFLYPDAWGSSAPGTFGAEDIFQIAEVANAEPHVFALWPHQASLLFRGPSPVKPRDGVRNRAEPLRTARGRRVAIPGWEPERGRLVVDTPFTQGVAGWPNGESVSTEGLVIDVDNAYATVVASSATDEPIARSRRLLVTAVGRIIPTGFAYADEWRRETASPGQPPLKQEPIQAKVLWKHKGPVKVYALDNNGTRLKTPVRTETDGEGTRIILDGTVPSLHWEMVAE